MDVPQINFTTVLSTDVGGFSLGKVLSAIVVFVACAIAIKLVMKLLERVMTRTKLEKKGTDIILRVVKVLLYAVLVIIVASTLGVNTSSILALVSVFSLGLAMAAEDILANIASGIVILATRPFELGSVIEVNGVSGAVKEIHLNHIRLETLDGVTVIVPNKEVASSKVTNFTAKGMRRINIVVTASYDTPTETVMKACNEAIDSCDLVLKDPAPAVVLSDYLESSIQYTLLYWVKPDDFIAATGAVRKALRDTFEANGAVMTYNHINVHMIQD